MANENEASNTVFVDDNSHVPDREPIRLGVFANYAAAVAACKRIIDEFLIEAHEAVSGITAHDLRSQFATFGDEPFGSPSPEVGGFSTRQYAVQRCNELCGEW